MKIIWLFKEHRDLYDENFHLKQMLHDTIAETNLAIANKDRTIADLEYQLKQKPALDIPSLVEELFQDRPYEDGRIPDDAWLTPGQPDRTTR